MLQLEFLYAEKYFLEFALDIDFGYKNINLYVSLYLMWT